MRIPEPLTRPTTIPQLRFVVEAGLTTLFAIAVATGVSEQEAALLLAGEIEPTDEQRGQFQGLLRDYGRAIKAVNAASMKQRLALENPSPND
jgi:hypothetical protein